MTKCPKCRKEIEILKHVQSGNNLCDCFLTNDRKGLTYQLDEFEADCRVNEWVCPECNGTLFTDENEALKFLQGT